MEVCVCPFTQNCSTNQNVKKTKLLREGSCTLPGLRGAPWTKSRCCFRRYKMRSSWNKAVKHFQNSGIVREISANIINFHQQISSTVRKYHQISLKVSPSPPCMKPGLLQYWCQLLMVQTTLGHRHNTNLFKNQMLLHLVMVTILLKVLVLFNVQVPY